MRVEVEPAQCGMAEISTCEIQYKKTLNTGGNWDFLILDGGMGDNLKLTAECYPENRDSNQKGSG